MLEAVHSVLKSAPVMRPNTEQVSTVDSFAANPDRAQKAAQAPYISPYVHMDVSTKMAVLQIRDSDTGDVVDQIPSEAAIQAKGGRQEIASEAGSLRQSLDLSSLAQRADVESMAQDQSAVEAGQESRSLSAQQTAAFESAARSGNSNAGNVSLFA